MSQLSPEVERRRRLVTRTLPLALIAVVAFVVGAAMGAPGSPEKEAANRFAESWARGDFAAMYEELNSASQAAIGLKEFTAAYREAEQIADRQVAAGAAPPTTRPRAKAAPSSRSR